MFTEIVTLSLSLLAAPRPVILDVDPGIDDALAILLAVRSPELDVRAITFVFGNVELELGVSNALKLLELVGRTDIPVARGEAPPSRGRGAHRQERPRGERNRKRDPP